MITKDIIVIPGTFWRRRLQAQKLYIELIKKGVFQHSMEKACDRLIKLEPRALVEALVKRIPKRRANA